MAKYDIIYQDIKSGTIQGILPISSFSYENVLSSPGSARIAIALSQSMPKEYYYGAAATPSYTSGATPYYSPELSLNSLAPGRTAIYIERGGVVVWSGILWNLDMDVNNNSATLGCEGWHSYWRKRYLRADKTYSSSTDDQANIAKGLIDWAQAQSGGNIGIDTTGVVATGIKRDRVYYAYERKNIATLIEQLGEVDQGFDWYYRTTKSGTTYTTQYLILYPKTGKVSPIRFELGSNVELLRCTVDAKTMADFVETTGAGETTQMIASQVVNADALNAYPLLEDQLSYCDVTSSTTLNQYAKRRIQTGKTPVIIPTLNVNPDLDPVFGSYSLGDQVKVVGSYGLFSINAQFRITAINVSVSAESKETISVTLAPAEIYE